MTKQYERPVCPRCGSSNVYTLKKTDQLQCRRCNNTAEKSEWQDDKRKASKP